jgi:hypothetical protein
MIQSKNIETRLTTTFLMIFYSRLYEVCHELQALGLVTSMPLLLYHSGGAAIISTGLQQRPLPRE